MIYLEQFRFPSRETEEKYISSKFEGALESNYYDNVYPFYTLSDKDFYCIDFEPVTILHGGNGSGKSTALNTIARKLHISRQSAYNSSRWLDDYTKLCTYHTDMFFSGEEFDENGTRQSRFDISSISKMLTSDDIFHMMQDTRVRNEQILYKSKIVQKQWRNSNDPDRADNPAKAKEYQQRVSRHLDFETGENVKEFCDLVDRRKMSFNRYMTKRIGKISRGFSNGESSLMELTELINDKGLYLLDEPENSMSYEFQIKLADIIDYTARRCQAQFIIATHSPFLLSIPNAKIYSLDETPVSIKNWWELDSMKAYYNLFASEKRFMQ